MRTMVLGDASVPAAKIQEGDMSALEVMAAD